METKTILTLFIVFVCSCNLKCLNLHKINVIFWYSAYAPKTAKIRLSNIYLRIFLFIFFSPHKYLYKYIKSIGGLLVAPIE